MKISECKMHGDLEEKDVFKSTDKNRSAGFRWRCIKCFDEKKQKNIDKNIANGFKMPEVITGRCRKHGDLNKDTGFICFDKTLPAGYRIRCKECTHNIRANSYHLNREKNIKDAAVWKSKNRARINEMVKIDRKNNPEKYARWAKDHYTRNREAVSLSESLRKMKIDKDFYAKMLAEQDNKCAICNMPETRMARDGVNKTRLCIDHDHDTGAVRQLLCHDCNTGIGKFKDTPELVLKAADYLIKHKGWTV